MLCKTKGYHRHRIQHASRNSLGFVHHCSLVRWIQLNSALERQRYSYSFLARQRIRRSRLRTGTQRSLNGVPRFFEFTLRELEAWRTHVRTSNTYFCLDQLDELHEVRNRVH